ncbi:hypothetical protein CXB51_004802 [Gossypium anomalum]|uniref:Uncharacterized protein n=1 Tax=Gossypium anomalum TaxID=47600 RepID=A0A8J5Z374_9ROSI|nr:hypothetical protein CXB51_004802 [Gossypium anomalum]
MYININKARRTKLKVLKEMEIDVIEEYVALYDFAEELKRSNKGTTNVPCFEHMCAALEKEKEMAVATLLDTNKVRFCKACFNHNAECNSVDNNLAEAFNASIIQARSTPIISMLNDIRLVVMEQCKLLKRLHDPLIRARLDKSIEESTKWNVHSNGDYGYNIMCGILCAHVVCAIYNKEEDPEKYLAICYTKEMYMRTYKYALQPINGPDL